MTEGHSGLEEFKRFRQKANERIIERGSRVTKRFFTLDTAAYRAGALDAKTKELLGLVASMVLRCDDCISYHIIQAILSGASDEEILETFDIALVVGGSIVIPHLRRAIMRLEECRELEQSNPELLNLEAEKKDTH